MLARSHMASSSRSFRRSLEGASTTSSFTSAAISSVVATISSVMISGVTPSAAFCIDFSYSRITPLWVGPPYVLFLLPTKRAVRRAQQGHYPSPAALFLEALPTEGLPQANRLDLGDDLGGHLGGCLLDLLFHLDGDLLGLLHRCLLLFRWSPTLGC